MYNWIMQKEQLRQDCNNKRYTELVKHQQLTNKLCSTLSLAPNSCESCLTSLLHKARADMIDVYSRAVNHDVRDKTQSKLTDEAPAYYSCWDERKQTVPYRVAWLRRRDRRKEADESNARPRMYMYMYKRSCVGTSVHVHVVFLEGYQLDLLVLY